MKKIISIIALLLFSSLAFGLELSILKLKGDVQYIRNKQTYSLTKNTQLKNEDIIVTNKNSYLRFKVHDSTITIAPRSYFQLNTSKEKTSSNEMNIGNLLYGHLFGNFIKDVKPNKRIRKVKMKTASLGIRGTRILLHVTRSFKEYKERMKGKLHPLPSVEELTALDKSTELYTQICCIDGLIEVETNARKKSQLKEGQVINYTSMGTKVNQFQFTKEQNLNSARSLGLLFD